MFSKMLHIFLDYFKAILIALVLALFIRCFIVQAFRIPSGSMLDTLQVGDHLLVLKMVYNVKIPFTNHTILTFSHPEHGDIIVFQHPVETKKDYIKRVIGTPGDTIEIIDKVVYRNGEPLEEPYVVHSDSRIRESQRDNFGPITLEPEQYFVLGDNRDMSRDSRYWGMVDESLIRGRAFVTYWSWDAMFQLSGWPWNWKIRIRDMRWERIGRLIH